MNYTHRIKTKYPAVEYTYSCITKQRKAYWKCQVVVIDDIELDWDAESRWCRRKRDATNEASRKVYLEMEAIEKAVAKWEMPIHVNNAEDDIKTVMDQARVGREMAVLALAKHSNLVDAILECIPLEPLNFQMPTCVEYIMGKTYFNTC